jgi:2-dehydropantoate 2-reductase
MWHVSQGGIEWGEAMKIGIVGAGAMGSVYGGLFAAAGNEVWLVDRWREHVEAIRRDGLRVTGASGDRVLRANATTAPAEAGRCALVVLATKISDLETAARAAGPMIGDDTAVLAIQNGLGNARILERVFGGKDFLVGIAGGFGASIKAPGHAHHNGMEKVHIAEAAGGRTARLDRVVEAWRGAGFKAEAYDDPGPMVWSKLLCSVAYSAPCTVLSLRIGQVLANDFAREVSAAAASEVFAVAEAKRIRLGFADPVAFARDFGSKIPNAMPSMLLDMLAGRRTEVDALYLSVAEEADAAGVRVPTIRMLAALVQALEAKHAALGQAYGPV